MDRIIECDVSFNNHIDGDFQMRTFEYESFDKLINDFETRDDIYIINSEMEGYLRPRQSKILKTVIKDDFHVEYIIQMHNNTVKVRFFKCKL
jgi:hypothetical protein